MSRLPLVGAGLTGAAAAGGGGPTLTGLRGWYKADALVLADGAAVASWTDSSGRSAHATQPTSGLRPTYKTAIINGLPVVRFSIASTTALNISAGLIELDANPFYVFAVLKPVAASGDAIVFTSGGAGYSLLCRHTGADWVMNANGGGVTISDTGGVTAGTTVLMTWLWDGANFTIRRSKVQRATAAGGSRNSAGSTDGIGFYATGGGYNWDGDMGELLVYNIALSGAQRDATENYLTTKWGL